MKHNIPELCKIKNKLAYYGLIRRSPSKSLICEWGFSNRQYDKCKKCPNKSRTFRFLVPPTLKSKNKN